MAQLGRPRGRRPPRYRRSLARFQYGPGAFKLDWALAGPIPWRAEACRRAGTLHLGGTFEEIAKAEHDVARGHHPDRPFVLFAQPSICDATRAPLGRHTAWAYCQVPNGSTVDMTARIERQIERFAPAPVPWLYLCSAATPPGGGVHGMCGYHAAQAVLRDMSDRSNDRRR